MSRSNSALSANDASDHPQFGERNTRRERRAASSMSASPITATRALRASARRDRGIFIHRHVRRRGYVSIICRRPAAAIR